MKKILVLGAPGSGKTFCALELSKKLNIPVYHLDSYYYKSNWVVASLF
jgi:adenylate kinase family enzyme